MEIGSKSNTSNLYYRESIIPGFIKACTKHMNVIFLCSRSWKYYLETNTAFFLFVYFQKSVWLNLSIHWKISLNRQELKKKMTVKLNVY